MRTNAKAQQSVNYANAIKKSNVQKMIDTVEFVQEHGFGIDDLPALLAATGADFDAKRAAIKETEAQLHKLSPVIQATRQYYKTKGIHSEYLKTKNKKKFRETHYADLAIYDAAVKELRAYYGEQTFKPIKELLAAQAQQKATKNRQYEDYCFARSKLRELRNIDKNIQAIYRREETGKGREERAQATNTPSL